MALHCDMCKNPAVWRITVETPGFKEKKGGAQINKYGCNNHKENLANAMELEIAKSEKELGKLLEYGPVKIVPLPRDM